MKLKKYINFIFIAVISLISIYIAFFGNIERALYKYLIIFSIIPVMLLPYIIKKVFKFEIEEIVITIYLIFVFLAHFLGTIVNLYYKIPIYDKIIHTLSGIMTSFLALILLIKFKKYNSKSIVFNIVFILSITASVAFLWEMFEYINDGIFGKDAQNVLTTGVNDTMTDMIVAFLGSSLFSLCYAFETKYLKKGLVNKFVEQIKKDY